MARAIWTGSVSFGLVNVPVKLYTATRQHQVRFHQLQSGTSSRIRYRRVNEDTGEEVAYEDIVRGVEADGDGYVVITQEELEQVEPGKSRDIEITDFVEASEIDPIHFSQSYYLGPAGEGAQKAYALLTRALERADRVAVATFVMRTKEHLAAIRPRDGVLVLETMYFADEVRNAAEEVDSIPVDADVKDRDLDTAVQLIDAMTTEWDPERYRDTYTERVEELVEAKRRDEEVVTREEPQSAGEVVDLLDALQASLEQTGKSRSSTTGRRKRAASDELADLSKGELYEMAQRLGVRGRSSMTRDELADAVRDAGEERAAS